MNKPYDFLTSDKEPFIYFDKSMIRMDDGFLTAFNGKNGKMIISPSSHMVLLLGMGTSISQDAAIFSAQHDMDIAFLRGDSNVHTVMKEIRMQDPYRLVNQVKNQEKHKLEIARELLKLRFKLLKYENSFINQIYDLKTIEEITLFEARWTKDVYKTLCIKNNIGDFKRDFKGSDIVNARLNILNNSLYSLCTSIALACHCSPSIGFIHGFSRRGGFSFDLADIIKTPTTVKMSFESDFSIDSRKLMKQLMTEIKRDKSKLTKILINVCLNLGEEFNLDKWNEIYERFNI